MIGLASMQATYAALEAICGDHFHDSYEKARIVFNKDGRFTTVMRDGQCGGCAEFCVTGVRVTAAAGGLRS